MIRNNSIFHVVYQSFFQNPRQNIGLLNPDEERRARESLHTLLAEVPGAARFNLHPAEHLLFW